MNGPFCCKIRTTLISEEARHGSIYWRLPLRDRRSAKKCCEKRAIERHRDLAGAHQDGAQKHAVAPSGPAVRNETAEHGREIEERRGGGEIAAIDLVDEDCKRQQSDQRLHTRARQCPYGRSRRSQGPSSRDERVEKRMARREFRAMRKHMDVFDQKPKDWGIP